MIKILSVDHNNASSAGFYCVQNRKSPGHMAKAAWLKCAENESVVIKIAVNDLGKQLGYIEYMEAEKAWRPVTAPGYLFIQCILVLSKDWRSKGVATMLVNECIEAARAKDKRGVCVLCSDGPWIADKSLFAKCVFLKVASQGRFDLMAIRFDDTAPQPAFNDWGTGLPKYKGWNLVYSDQCPWHQKSVNDLKQAATDHGITLKIHKLETPAEAQMAPSGFGTFALINDGQLLEDHYISRTRFDNILKKESGHE